jgi:arylsulfatase A-like enzyme
MLNVHAAAACSPTRAMLLSGTDAHLGGLGVLIEYKNSEKGAKRWSGKAGYEGYLNNDVATLPEILGDNGYFTVMSGKVSLFSTQLPDPSFLGRHNRQIRPICQWKTDTYCSQWHLGLRAQQGPWNRGFQKAFAMLPGCCNHYGWEPVQEQFPVGGRPIHAEDGRKVEM